MDKQDQAAEEVLQGDTVVQQRPLTSTAEVKLIQPARLPAGHSKVVRVEVSNPEVNGEVCLFEPDGEDYNYLMHW